MINVHNEVGTLQRVLVHEPGAEVVRMTQFELEPLLFDDILSVDLARQEHKLLQEILGHEGAEVIEFTDVLRRALACAPVDAVVALLDRVCAIASVSGVAEPLSAWPPEDLARALVEGVAWEELPAAPWTLSRLRNRLDERRTLALPPLPNLMFMRDPCISLYDRVIMGRMATGARARESVLVRFALAHGLGESVSFLFDQPQWDRQPIARSLEGGDVLVISDQVLLIGCSERTSAQTIERLAQEYLFPSFPKLQRVHAVMMPHRRSVMHLDTVLTAIDHGLFLGHAPMIAHGIDMAVVQLERQQAPRLLEKITVEALLQAELGDTTKVVPCGGHDPLHQSREQWTDGANAVCLGPGKIVLYSRNVRTARTLVEEHGFEQVRLAASQDPELRAQRLDAVGHCDRVVYSFEGSELSRARGGGRCLTMPLNRG